MLGTVIKGKYRIIEELGHGGQGSVYKAENIGLAGQLLAIKIITMPGGLKGPNRSKEDYFRFQREAEITARLRHPQIAQVIDFGIDDSAGPGNEIAFMVRQYLDGQTLTEYIAENGSLDTDEGIKTILSLAGVLDYLHGQGVIHRDLKSSNVFLQHGLPVLIDFGLGHSEGLTMMSHTGQVLGTYSFLAPELLSKETREKYQYAPCRDWWGLGCIAFELLTGDRLIDEDDTQMVILSLTQAEEQKAIDEKLRGHKAYPIVKTLLERDPEKRATSVNSLEAIMEVEAKLQKQLETEVREREVADLKAKVEADESRKSEEDRRSWLEEERKKKDLIYQARARTVKTPGTKPSQPLIRAPRKPSPKAGIENWQWIVAAVMVIGAIVAIVIRNREKPPIENPEVPHIELTSVKGQDCSLDLGNGVKLDMVWIPSGSFLMGSPSREYEDNDDEGPQQQVSVSGFWLGKYEVTQAQYEAITGDNPSFFDGVNNPVEKVKWNDSMEFCRKLSTLTGGNFTLPTEAQWEYACRAGSSSAYYFGDNVNQLGKYSWYYDNSNGKTHPVGGKQKNSWGLYDTLGNVGEWCLTLYQPYPYSETDGRNELTNYGDRVVRGGGKGSSDYHVRCADRSFGGPLDRRYAAPGFRCALIP